MSAFREAIVNAFVHNKWVDGNAPMITVYSNRVEILSRGTLDSKQTIEGFYMGESIPVNQRLSDIFLQLHISERSGRGVPKIIELYSKDVFEFRENSISVNIPFRRINHAKNKVKGIESLNDRRKKILEELRDNPNLTIVQLSEVIGVGVTATENNIKFLRENGYIERIGSKKGGYWKVK